MSNKVKFDICSFRVPLTITKKEDGDEVDITATFKEVDMTDLCCKIETRETEDAEEAKKLAAEVAAENEKVLTIASRIRKEGDIAIRKILCEHGKVKITVTNNL